MTAEHLLLEILERGVQLWATDGELGFRAPRGALTTALRDRLRAARGEILALLGPDAKYAAASSAQKRLWFLDRWRPGDAAYNLAVALHLRGDLDPAALGAALGGVVRRHDALRTTFRELAGSPVQRIGAAENDAAVNDLRTVDLRRLAPGARSSTLARLGQRHADRPFDLARGPLLRAVLASSAKDDHALLVAVHHSVVDGTSQGIFYRDLEEFYRAARQHRPARLPGLRRRPGDVAAAEHADLHDPDRRAEAERDLEAWRVALDGSAPLELPLDRPRPLEPSSRGGSRPVALEVDRVAALRALAGGEGASLFMVLLAAYFALLFRLGGGRDLTVGAPTAQRDHPDLHPLVGFLVNTLVLRARIVPGASFGELLRSVRRVVLDAFGRKNTPFERLVEILEPERDPSRHPLYQATFALQPTAVVPRHWAGLEARPMALAPRTARFDLELTLSEVATRVEGSLDFNRDLFDDTTIVRWHGHFLRLLDAVVAAPDAPLEALEILAPAERQQMLVEWNAAARSEESSRSTVWSDLFDAVARRRPDTIAVIWDADPPRLVSYAELDRRATRLAARLRRLGAGPESWVGLSGERSVELIVGTVGILRAGAAYLPLDPAYPDQRLAYMLRDAGARLVVGDRASLARLPDVGAPRLALEDVGREFDVFHPEAGPPAAVDLHGDHPAYVIYTSGSTGRPKGVVIPHRGLVNLLADDTWELRPGDVIAQFASFSFDASVWEITSALARGATLWMAPRDAVLPGPGLAERLRSRRVRAALLTPSALAALPAEDAADPAVLPVLLAGGEACPPELAARWAPGRRFKNAYGPSEASVCTAVAPIGEGALSETLGTQPLPIGRPLPGVRLHLLDARARLVPLGAVGEIHVGGIGLARGYLGRPARTAQSFVPDPFVRPGDDAPGGRLYRTGDLGRRLADGRLTFHRRRDHQVKLRGFRIELGEIEAALRARPEVRDAAAVVDPAARRIVAFVAGPQAERLVGNSLRRALGEHLPEFMVPSAIVALDALPRTPGGKLDRRALERRAGESAPADDAELEPPRTPDEQVLAEIWRDVLGCDALGQARQIGREQNFFALGGHSLLATQVTSRLREMLGVELEVREIFEHPTLAGLAGRLAEARHRRLQAPPLVAAPHRDGAPLSFAQQRLWSLDRLSPGSAAYNMPVLFELGAVDGGRLGRALDLLLHRHEALRTRLPEVDGRPVQRIEPHLPGRLLARVDLDALAAADRRRAADRLLRGEIPRPFDLAAGPMLRCVLLRLGKARHHLLTHFHHIASDGWSMGVFERELAAFYRDGARAALPALEVQYADFAIWQRRWLRGAALDALLEPWRRRLGGLPALRLPTDRQRPAQPSGRGAMVRRALPEELTDRLRAAGRERGASLFMTLLAAVWAVLGRLADQRDVAVGAPIANRTRRELEGLIGFFVNPLVLRGDLGGRPTFATLIDRARDTALEAFANQDVPFEKIVEALNPERSLDRNPLFQVAFALQNAPRARRGALGEDDFELRQIPLGDEAPVRVDLEAHFWEVDGRVEAFLDYAVELFDAPTIHRLAGTLERLIDQATAQPERPLDALDLLSRAERQQIAREWNDTAAELDPDAVLHQLILARAAERPDAVALAYGAPDEADILLTYGALAERSAEIARRLLALGLEPEARIGLAMARSVDMVTTLLGVLRAGCAYVPLDPAYPKDRLRFMVADSGCSLVLAQLDSLEPGNDAQALPVVYPEHLAYVLYTSGSTGRPKGAMVRHRGLVNLARDRTLGTTAEDRVLQFASLSFDASIFEITLALSAGATLHLTSVSPPLIGPVLAERLARQRLTQAVLAPSALGGLGDADVRALPALRTVLLAGEACPVEIADRWSEAGRRVVIDAYGPTETTVCASKAPWTRQAWRPPIGRPLVNTEIHLADRRLRLRPLGGAGELLIGGTPLARGYHGRPALTAERFVPDPWSGRPGDRLYRSGDLARLLADGQVDFLGRLDHQVKLRGYRIEPGEVEAVLGGHPEVREAVVAILRGALGNDADEITQRLVAWVTPNLDADTPQEDEHVDHWRELYDDLYARAAGDGTEAGDGAEAGVEPTFNIAGWNSSYTNAPLPAEEMREWVEATVARILALDPRGPGRVLELGCGSGLLLFRVAPHAEHYLGTDLAGAALAGMAPGIAAHGLGEKVELECRKADDLAGLSNQDGLHKTFDLVILNSVAQYFPDADYLRRVLDGAVDRLAVGGRLFVGDVRSLPLHAAFCASVELFQAPGELSLAELAERARRHARREGELVVAPALFDQLAARLRAGGRSCRVRLLPKRADGRGRSLHRNELTLFRYDVVLELDTAPGFAPAWQSLETLGGADALRRRLRDERPELLALRDLVNPRLDRETRLLALLDDPSARRLSVAEVRRLLDPQADDPQAATDAVDPDSLAEFGAELGYDVELGWAAHGADGRYDAVLRRRDRPGDPSIDLPPIDWRPAEPCDGELANRPLLNRAAQKLPGRLRSFLEDHLPTWMVPAAFVVLEDMPRLPNGKVDRGSLPEPERDRPVGETAYRPPEDEIERRLASIWAAVLGVERVGGLDNFFELGGDSVLSLRIVAKANEAGLRLTARDLFQHQTVAALATAARAAADDAATTTRASTRIGEPFPLTPIQRWLLIERGLPEPWHFNQSILLALRRPIDPARLRAALEELARRHDALRLRFPGTLLAEGKQRGAAPGERPHVAVAQLDLDALAAVDRRRALERIAASVQPRFDLADGPLVRAVLATPLAAPGRADAGRLLLTLHHLVVDAVSWRILLDELGTLLAPPPTSRNPWVAPVSAPPPTTSFQAWAETLAAGAERLAELELEHWRRLPRRATRLPGTGAAADAPVETLHVALDAERTEALLRRVATAWRARPDEALLTALALAARRWTGRDEVLIEREGHGREEALFEGVDLSRTVGWLTTLHPLRLDLAAVPSGPNIAGGALQVVKEQARAVPHGGLGWGVLRALHPDPALRAELDGLAEPEILFNYFGRLDSELDDDAPWTLAEESVGPEQGRGARRARRLEINARVVGGRLRIDLSFARDDLRRGDVESLADDLLGHLDVLARTDGGLSPSDVPLAGLDAPSLARLVERLGVAPGEIEDIFPLSPMQEGMLFHTLYSPDSAAYFEQLAWRAPDDLDADAFRRAWHHVLRRHDVLRAAFAWEGLERPLQIVLRDPEPPFEEVEVADADAYRALLAADRRRGFRLLQAPLLRIVLARRPEGRTDVVWSSHHLLLDGWSGPLVLGEVLRAYDVLRGALDEPLEASAPPPAFRDYIAWLESRDRGADERFWRRALEGFEPSAAPAWLAPARPREGGEAEQLHLHRTLDGTIAARLAAFARQNRLTLNTLVQGAWALLLLRGADARDVIFGATVAGRPEHMRDVGALVGLLINTLPVRVRVRSGEGLGAWLEEIQQMHAEGREHGYCGLAEIQRWAGTTGASGLFETLVVFQSYPVQGALDSERWRRMVRDVREFHETNYPLTLLAAPTGTEGGTGTTEVGLGLRLSWAPERIEHCAARRLADHLTTLLSSLAEAEASTPLAALEHLRRAERHQLLIEWNDTADSSLLSPEHLGVAAATLPELLARQARLAPDAVALVDADSGETWTYAELERRAEALAARLRRRGVGPEVHVGLCAERSLAQVLAVHAVIRAGGAYVPLDPEFPVERLAEIVEDALPAPRRLLLIQESLRAVVEPLRGRAWGEQLEILAVDVPDITAPDAEPEPRERPLHPDHAAYLIYTSGSTGRPKGALNTHRAVVNRLLWYLRRDALGPDDAFLYKTPYSFDVSVVELLGVPLSGARLVIARADGHRDPRDLHRVMVDRRVSRVHFVPSMLRAFLDQEAIEQCRALRRVLVSGEALPGDLQDAFHARSPAALLNLYGPTEAAVDVSAWESRRGAAVVLGRPLANVRLRVLDRDGGLAAIGIAGELHIGGVQTMRGYWRRAALTAEKLVPDAHGASGERLYRTGDRARLGEDGEIEYLGRLDHQVKIRGLRVELGEIEAALDRHPAVGGAAALARRLDDAAGHDTAGHDKTLVAFVAIRDEAIDETALLDHLRRWVPGHAVPSRVVLLDALPLNPNGKIDRRALAARPLAARRAADAVLADLPRTPFEELVAQAFAEVLAPRAADRPKLGGRAHFFHLGGHSLLATQVVSRLRRAAGVDLAVRDLFEHPTVGALAARLEALLSAAETRDAAPPLVPALRLGDPPVSFAQQRLWFLNALEPESAAYNSPAALAFDGPLDERALDAALGHLRARHESLRTSFPEVDGVPVQRIAAPSTIQLPTVDLTRLDAPEARPEARRLLHVDAWRPFDLHRGPLTRPLLVRLAPGRALLYLNLHHIISDGWSWGVLLRELTAIYTALAEGRAPGLPPLPVQYADFAAWQRAWLRGDVLERQLAFWRARLANAATLQLPTDRPRPAVLTERGDALALTLPSTLRERLDRLTLGRGVSLYMVLLTAFATLLGRLSGARDLIVGAPIANRNRQEIEGLIGFFVNTLALRLDLGATEDEHPPTVGTLLDRARETALGAYAHQDLPFEKLVEALDPERDLARNPIFQVLLALQNVPRAAETPVGLEISTVDLATRSVRFDLELFVWEELPSADRASTPALRAELAYNRDLFDRTTIRRWSRHFVRLLEALEPERRLDELPHLDLAERHQLLVEFDDTAADIPAPLPVLLAERAALAPDAIALVFDSQNDTLRQISHGELARRALALAGALDAAGIGPERRVGLLLERGPALLVGLWGTLFAGGVYVPLDPSHPPSRLGFILEDAGIDVLLVDGDTDLSLEPPPGAVVLALDRDGRPLSSTSAPLAAPRETNPRNLAYVLYTSGSTGKPKGVGISLYALANFLESMRREPGLAAGETWLALTTISFDIAGLELHLPPVVGARIVLLPQAAAADPRRLERALAEHRVDVLQATPATWRLLLENGWSGRPTLRALCGGEALPVELAGRVAERVEVLWNVYGPTETTIWSLARRLAKGAESVPIGRPLANTDLAVVGRDGAPVPLGAAGELLLGGDGLARGYLGRPGLTAERFVPDPGAGRRGKPSGARLYRTGDLARIDGFGEAHYLGRLDHQVKIRGFRIELGEIEACLERHPRVARAAVLVRGGEGGEARLAAWWTLADGDAHSNAHSDADAAGEVDQWSRVWDDVYRDQPSAADLDLAGWRSSFDGEPIPVEEMRRWIDATVERILEPSPRRVLEIGCGTGLLLLRVAPRTERYTGSDVSATVLARLGEVVAARDARDPGLAEKVRLEVGAAHRLDEILPPGERFDRIVINSVAQYFPDVDYLVDVLRRASRRLTPGGTIFLGDLRSLPLLPAFHAELEFARASDALSRAELAERVRARREPELTLDPALFNALRTAWDDLAEVRVRAKGGRYDNELERYRYDVELRFGGPPAQSVTTPRHARHDWRDEQLDLDKLGRELAACSTDGLDLVGVPDARSAASVVLADWLLADADDALPADVGAWRAAWSARVTERFGAPVDPEDLVDLAARHGFVAEIGGAERGDGTFDAALRRRSSDAGPPRLPSAEIPSRGGAVDWSRFANRPQVAPPSAAELRAHCAERLPEYMVPGVFALVDAMPLTPSGKLDRKELASRPLGEAPERGEFEPPATPTEKALAEIWQALLGVGRIGRGDDFFHLGGHSLLAVRLMAALAERFGERPPLTVLFRHSTLEKLAAHLDRTPAPRTAADPLVVLQDGAPGTAPLVLVHPVGGHVLCYRDLVRALGPDLPVFGLEARGRDALGEKDSIRRMAEDYVDALRRVQPRGPYRLAGWSMGGAVAVEMARALRAAGEEIALLAVLDLVAEPDAEDELARRASVAERSAASLRVFGRDLGLPADHPCLAPQSLRSAPEAALGALFAAARGLGLVGPEADEGTFQELFRLFLHNAGVFEKRCPDYWDGDLLLFRPEAREHADDALGWRAWCRRVEVVAVEGDHFTMLEQPRARALAAHLGRRLRAC